MKVRKGVVQGSALSPILFNIYLDDLLDLLAKRVGEDNLFAYADDVMLIWETSADLYRYIKIINDWC